MLVHDTNKPETDERHSVILHMIASNAVLTR